MAKATRPTDITGPGQLLALNPDTITTGDNVRDKVQNIGELINSIAAVGLLQPLIVEHAGVNDAGHPVWRLVAGHRRLEAVRRLGWDTVPAVLTTGKRVAVQLVENIQREQLTPLEEAAAYAELVEAAGSQQAAAELVGRSKAHISKRLKLLTLTDEGQAAVAAGAVTLEQAFELAKVNPKRQRQLVDRVAAGLAPSTLDAHFSGAVAEEQRDAEERHAAKAAEAKPSRELKNATSIVALCDRPARWRPLDGVNGLTIEWDRHQREECNVATIGYPTTWSSNLETRFWCADAKRHDPDGESRLKLDAADELDAKRQAKAAEQRAEAEARNEARAAWRDERLAELTTTAAGFKDRNLALAVLSRVVLDWIGINGDLGDAGDALRAVGVENVPEATDDPTTWGDYDKAIAKAIADLKPAQLYRAALWAVGAQIIDYGEHGAAAAAVSQALAIKTEGRPE